MEKLSMDEIIQAILEGKEPNQPLDRILALPRSEQEELIRRLGTLKSPLAGAFLSTLYPRLSDKVLQKLAKKAIFHLKTLGIAVEEPKVAGESALKPIDTSREAMGLLSNYDGESLRVILAAVELKKNQFLFSHAISHFSNGLVDLQSMAVSRPQARGAYPGLCGENQDSHPVDRDIAALRRIFDRGGCLCLGARYGRRQVPKPNALIGQRECKETGRYLSLRDRSRPRAGPIRGSAGGRAFQAVHPRLAGDRRSRKRLNDAINPGIVLPPSAILERKTDFFVELVKKGQIQPVLPAFKRMLEDSAYLFFCLKESAPLCRHHESPQGARRRRGGPDLFPRQGPYGKGEERRAAPAAGPHRRSLFPRPPLDPDI